MQVQDIKDFVSPFINTAELIDSAIDGVSLAEGVQDIFKVVSILKQVKPAIAAVKSGNLLSEYKALDPEGQKELIQWFDSEFDIKEDSVEDVVEKVWGAVVSLSDLFKSVQGAQK